MYIYMPNDQPPVDGTLETMQRLCINLGHAITVIDQETGQAHTIYPPTQQHHPAFIGFDRVQAMVRVHVDDRAKIHRYAKHLNARRKASQTKVLT